MPRQRRSGVYSYKSSQQDEPTRREGAIFKGDSVEPSHPEVEMHCSIALILGFAILFLFLFYSLNFLQQQQLITRVIFTEHTILCLHYHA